jgi:LacI family transcriptional regulator
VEGSLLVSIKEVAHRAGVSVGTVSNVLNRPGNVNEDTLQRVRTAISELGYVRNESARQLRAGQSRTIGLVVLDVANPFFTDLARGVESLAHDADMVVTLCNSDNDGGRQARHLDVLAQQRVRGVLITPLDTHAPSIQHLVDHGIPVVLVDRGSEDATRCSVSVDDVHGGRLAGAHLAGEGHDRIAFVGGPFDIRQVSDRLEGLRAGAPQADVQVVEVNGLSVADGREAARHVIEMPVDRRPTAVLCANDLIALGMLQEVVRAGLRVPEDLALVGYDDIDFAAAAVVPLSSVRQPREQLGRAAAELLLEEAGDAAGQHIHRQVVFRPELVVRTSSGGPDGFGTETVTGEGTA